MQSYFTYNWTRLIMCYINQKIDTARPLVRTYGCFAVWAENYSEKVKVFLKSESGLFSLLVRGIKLMSYSPPQAHQLLLVHVAIEKLTSSKQNKWQNATKGTREWTELSLRRISLLVPYRQRRTRQKRRPRFELLLGNWGSRVWNVYVSLRQWYPSLRVHWPWVTQFVFFFFFSLNASIMYFLFDWGKKAWGALGREQPPHILSVPVKLLSNCCRAAGGADICFSLAAGCRSCRSHSLGCHTHSVCSTWANRL